MSNFTNKISALRRKMHKGIQLKLTAHFYVVIASGKIYLIYKPHKESVVKIGNIEF